MEDGSFTDRLLKQEKRNEEVRYDTGFDSSEYQPEHFGLGKVTGKVFEEIHDEEDEWESFLTTMFLVGIILIPVQLIFADNLKPYDAFLVEIIQSAFMGLSPYLDSLYFFIRDVLSVLANVKFLMSITVFFYLCFDPGIAFKTSLVGSFGAYLVFILKLIIHDARPFWVDPNIIPGVCKMSYGSPSLDVFVGMVYSHYLFFCTDRALMSDDKFINKSRSHLVSSKILSISLMVLNYIVGVFYFCYGDNFIYQILITFFYGFIFIRIVIAFNKEIDGFSNGSRFLVAISNVLTIGVMFLVGTLAILSCMVYSIVSNELLIPREWTNNISKHCSDTSGSPEISIRITFLDSTALFHILGATMGINLVLKNVKNYNCWFATNWASRIARGLLGFLINYIIIGFTRMIKFKSLTSDYFIDAFLYTLSGYVSFGCLPLIFSFIGLTNRISPIEEKQMQLKSLNTKVEPQEEILFPADKDNEYYSDKENNI